jgi:hypothetical protein
MTTLEHLMLVVLQHTYISTLVDGNLYILISLVHCSEAEMPEEEVSSDTQLGGRARVCYPYLVYGISYMFTVLEVKSITTGRSLI